MSRAKTKPCLFSLILLFIFPLSVHAIPAINCHCFTDRSYDPARPAAADPYFLATTQNSFFAIVFDADKKTLVMKKQKGTSADDLWIAYWVASKSGASPDSLLQARQEKNTWRDAVAPLGLSSKALGVRFTSGLNSGASSATLAQTVVDDLLVLHRLLGDVELTAMRKSGASNQEVIIAALIAARTKQPAKHIYLEVKNGAKTWGSQLQGARIDIAEMPREISAILKLQPR